MVLPTMLLNPSPDSALDLIIHLRQSWANLFSVQSARFDRVGGRLVISDAF